ncbi:hypothetical protein VTK26DRAFT_4280 [Humicola hyalothermophila]
MDRANWRGSLTASERYDNIQKLCVGNAGTQRGEIPWDADWICSEIVVVKVASLLRTKPTRLPIAGRNTMQDATHQPQELWQRRTRQSHRPLKATTKTTPNPASPSATTKTATTSPAA